MFEFLIHSLVHSLKDNIHLLVFLFIAFFIIELFEHKFSEKSKKLIEKSGKFGPIVGAFFGVFPQCGFSVVATNFYITRVISIGTLISIYLATSDEMLPIMVSRGVSFKVIFGILLIKFITGVIFGLIIDLIIRKKTIIKKYDYNICDEEHCECEHGIIKSSFKHTLKTFIFIVFVSFIINIIFETVGENLIDKIFMKNNLFGSFIGAIIGLIPNCAASVILTELFLNNSISLGTTIAGLLTGSGVALLVLFKTNKSIKENLLIITLLYSIGVLVGIFIEIIGLLF